MLTNSKYTFAKRSPLLSASHFLKKQARVATLETDKPLLDKTNPMKDISASVQAHMGAVQPQLAASL